VRIGRNYRHESSPPRDQTTVLVPKRSARKGRAAAALQRRIDDARGNVFSQNFLRHLSFAIKAYEIIDEKRKLNALIEESRLEQQNIDQALERGYTESALLLQGLRQICATSQVRLTEHVKLWREIRTKLTYGVARLGMTDARVREEGQRCLEGSGLLDGLVKLDGLRTWLSEDPDTADQPADPDGAVDNVDGVQDSTPKDASTAVNDPQGTQEPGILLAAPPEAQEGTSEGYREELFRSELEKWVTS